MNLQNSDCGSKLCETLVSAKLNRVKCLGAKPKCAKLSASQNVKNLGAIPRNALAPKKLMYLHRNAL